MEKRSMEKLGVATSLLGFGCMRFPVDEEGRIDEVRAEEMLDRAISAGVNYIDTAYPYHDKASEPFVGRVLKKYKRDSFYLATKLPVWLVETVEDVERIFEQQLARLQTDYVDFYLLHAMNRERYDKMKEIGALQVLEAKRREGKIKYIGFSFHDSYDVFEEMINDREWDFCQIQLNYMDASEQAGLRGYELAAAKEIPVIVMEPVKGGSLAVFSEDITQEFKKLDEKASVASFALRWVGSLPGVKVILSGMSNMEQVEDNLKTFENFRRLSEEETLVIDRIVAILNSRIQNGCTGCRYCMPCPAGVDIPACFRTWNTYHMYRNYHAVSWQWEQEIGLEKQAKNCIKCGKCEQVCPQKLSIREDLVKVQSDMEEKKYIL